MTTPNLGTFPVGLTLDGDLNLLGDNTDPTGLVYTVEAMNDGASWGSPAAVIQTISAFLADGSVVTREGADNRTLTLSLRVKADSTAALAAGEAQLFARCSHATTLTFTPPQTDEDAVIETVFEVWVADLAPSFAQDDGTLNEQLLKRFYDLTLTAKPFSRSANLTLVPALDAVPLTDETFINTVLDDGTSLTGWAGSPNTATHDTSTADDAIAETITTVNSARVPNQLFAASPKYTLTLTRTFGSAVDMSDTPYLVVKSGMAGISWTQQVKADGVVLQLVTQTGHERTYRMPTGVTSFTVLKVTASFFTKWKMTVKLRVSEVRKTNGTGSVATGKQLARSLWVKGSARTFGSVSVQHESDGLGDVIVYTVPSSTTGYVPAMQSYQTDGPTPSADSTAVTGVKQHIDVASVFADSGVAPTFTIPSDQLIEGTYGVVARLKTTDDVDPALDYRFLVTSQVSGHDDTVNQLRAVHTFADNDWHIVWLGTATFPPLAIPDESTQDVLVSVTSVRADLSDTSDVFLDELWLFNLDDGAVSIVSAGDAQRVWLDSPDGDRLNPRVFVGSDDGRADAVGASMSSDVAVFGSHVLIPGRMDVFTVTTDAADAAADVGYYPRWHTHAAE